MLVLAIGQVDSDSLKFIKRGLKDVFSDVEVEAFGTVMSVPEQAYSSSRRQYYSTRILAKIRDYLGIEEAQYVLGVTEVDLYVPGLNFVFGEAQPDRRTAVISLFRLRPEFYGEESNIQLFHERALKEAIHELGHTLGIGHCKNSLCVMAFSNSILETDRKMAKFCEDCNLLVNEVLEKYSGSDG